MCLSGAGHSLAATTPTDTIFHRVVEEVVSGNVTEVPEGFEAVMGYSPMLENGRLVKPDGECSSPVSPPEFANACRVHDFGYDLLRYGERTGRGSSPDLRGLIDAQFRRDMLAACDGVGCRLLADLFSFGVGLNSIRQWYTAPAEEPVIPWVVAGTVVVGLSFYRPD